MTVSSLPAAQLSEAMQGKGLCIRTGPFAVRLKSDVRLLHEALRVLYADYPLLDDTIFCDFELTIRRRSGLRRWVRPQAQFLFDGVPAFEPVPQGHALPLLEWGMNWCISNHAHHYLLLHAAVLERDGRAAVLPAPPGSGKSTLCAALMFRGWRLLSDEMALIDPASANVWPLARPLSLKNESIGLIESFEPSAEFSTPVKDTAKGTVAHLRVPGIQVARSQEPASVAWIVFPQYLEGQAAPSLAEKSRAEAVMELGNNSFNYTLLGRRGFDCLCNMVSAAGCYAFQYSRLDDGVGVFEALSKREAECPMTC